MKLRIKIPPVDQADNSVTETLSAEYIDELKGDMTICIENGKVVTIEAKKDHVIRIRGSECGLAFTYFAQFITFLREEG